MAEAASVLFVNGEPISVQRSDVDHNAFHRHNFLEIAYIAKGTAIHDFNHTTVTVHEGDYFAIDYNEAHRFQHDSAYNGKFEVINILFKPEFIDPSLKECRGFPDLVAHASINCSYFNLQAPPTGVIYHDENGEVLALFQKMLREYTQQEPKYRELLRCCLIELIILTLRRIYKNVGSIAARDQTLNHLLEYVQQNFAQNIRLKDISAHMGYTQSYLSAMFTQTMGIPFSKYLQNIRLAHACDLLTNTQKSFVEIAEACGYYDVKFFRYVSRGKLKLSPSEFRKASRQQMLL